MTVFAHVRRQRSGLDRRGPHLRDRSVRVGRRHPGRRVQRPRWVECGTRGPHDRSARTRSTSGPDAARRSAPTATTSSWRRAPTWPWSRARGRETSRSPTTTRTLLSTTITPTRSGPAVDRLGSTVVTDLVADGVDASPGTDIAVTEVPRRCGVRRRARFDLGAGDVGAELTSTVTFSNRGPSSVGVASLEVDGTFLIAEDRCGSEIRPVTTCEIDVTFSVERLEDAIGVVTLTPTRPGVAAFTTEVVALSVKHLPSRRRRPPRPFRGPEARPRPAEPGERPPGVPRLAVPPPAERRRPGVPGPRPPRSRRAPVWSRVRPPSTSLRRSSTPDGEPASSRSSTTGPPAPRSMRSNPTLPGRWPFQIVETTCTVGQTLAAGARSVR